MAVGVGLNNFGKIIRFNPETGAFDWPALGVFHNPFKNRRTSPNGKGYKQQTNEAKDKRFWKHTEHPSCSRLTGMKPLLASPTQSSRNSGQILVSHYFSYLQRPGF